MIVDIFVGLKGRGFEESNLVGTEEEAEFPGELDYLLGGGNIIQPRNKSDDRFPKNSLPPCWPRRCRGRAGGGAGVGAHVQGLILLRGSLVQPHQDASQEDAGEGKPGGPGRQRLKGHNHKN